MTINHSLQPILDFVLRERGWTPSPRVFALSSQLAPVSCAGLELHLDNSVRLDIQQRIKGPSELLRLRHFLSARPVSAHGDAWAALTRFCQQDQATEIAEELWLELDDAPNGTQPLSIFAKLPEILREDPSSESVEAAILKLLHLFGAPIPDTTTQALRFCLLGCHDGASISHIGMMLGRVQAPLRLIIESIPASDFGDFLGRVGLGHLAARVQARVDDLFVHADRIRLALTLTDSYEETVGLECFVGDPSQNDARIEPLCEQLPGWVHCPVDLQQRLLKWPASILPHEARAGWPGVLIAQALGEGPEQLSWLDCRISHVKVNLNGGNEETAKIYFGFVQARSPAPQKGEGLTSTAEGDVLLRGFDAILRARTQAGWWVDYPGFAEGPADEWVTAYVANACLETGDARLFAAADRAWMLLSSRPRDGWGWNFVQPADADSTAWVLRLAQSLGRLEEPRAQVATDFLAQHVTANGSVATYLPESHRERFPEVDINPDWHRGHLCVTAAAASLNTLAETPLTCLLREQREDGAWQGYWWADTAYATAIATSALSGSTGPAARAAVVRAANWAHTRLMGDVDLHNNPFILALVLRTALHMHAPDTTLLQRRVRELGALQGRDGLWQGSASLCIPNAAGGLVEATDRYGIFTSATVLAALAAARNAGYL